MEVRVYMVIVALFSAFGSDAIAADQSPINQILDKTQDGLREDLKTIDAYYEKITEKTKSRSGPKATKLNGSVAISNFLEKEKSTFKKAAVRQVPLGSRKSTDRDPFAYTDRIRKNDLTFRGSSVSYAPKSKSILSGLPKMKMKGFLKGRDDESLALLEIEGTGVHMVRAGDVIGLQEAGIDAVIRILELKDLSVIVETGSSGRLMVVR